jgi:hypothetical protein
LLAIMSARSSLRILRFTNRTDPSMNIVTATKPRPSFSARRPSKDNSSSRSPLEIVSVRPPGAWYEAPIYYVSAQKSHGSWLELFRWIIGDWS